MKATIFDIKRFAINDGPGIRQTIFFKGCTLKCQWCHNPESLKTKPEYMHTTHKLDDEVFSCDKNVGYCIFVETLFDEINRDAIFFEESDGGVTFSGGEPLIQYQFILKIASECKKAGIHTAIDTSGYAPKNVIAKIAKNIDLFLYDLKLANNEHHIKYTGVSNSQIIENLRFLDKMKKDVIVRIPIIPTITDNDENIEGLIRIMNQLSNINSVNLLPYHKTAKNKYRNLSKKYELSSLESPSNKKMEAIKAKLTNNGFCTTI